MQTAQSRITDARAASREAGARYLLLLAAGISFVLSVTLWFGGHELQGSSSGSGCRRSSRSAGSC